MRIKVGGGGGHNASARGHFRQKIFVVLQFENVHIQ